MVMVSMEVLEEPRLRALATHSRHYRAPETFPQRVRAIDEDRSVCLTFIRVRGSGWHPAISARCALLVTTGEWSEAPACTQRTGACFHAALGAGGLGRRGTSRRL